MLPGNIPALMGGPPPVTYGVDRFTVALFKFDGAYNVPLAGNALIDYAKPSRLLISGGAGNKSYGTMFCGTCLYSDGSGVKTPASDPDFNFSGDFTVDFWMVANGSSAAYDGPVVSKTPAAGYSPFMFYQASGVMYLYASSTGTSWDIANGQPIGSISAATWTHFAVQRKGNNWLTFCNGNAASGWTSSLTPVANTAGICIGTGGGGAWGGFIDELRVSSCARYAGTFSNQLFPYYGALNGGNDGATKLLMHMEDWTDSASGAAAGTPHLFTLSGSAAISTAQSKFGGKSAHFDATPGCLAYSNTSPIDLMSGNKDFTVDLWYYRVGPATGQIVGMRTSQTQYCSWIIYDNIAAGNITIFLSSTGSDWAIAQNTPVGAVGSGVWTHLALVRSATLGKISFFINGAQTYSVSLASTVWLAGVQNSLGIGGNSEATSGVSAYIDELRFSDVARWTGTSFTPPAAPYA